MGTVFKAQHRRMERTVAVKVLAKELTADPKSVDRFQREVKAAAKLTHPNIVAAYDADEADGVHFLVMEYVAGRDLSVLVKKNGPLSVRQSVGVLLQAAQALEFAHANGVIHRDIKPANLLVDAKGVLKLLDMGLARNEGPGLGIPSGIGLDQATLNEITNVGAIMGTIGYMAPEQAVNAKNADIRCDVYSLGCTLHFLLIGRQVYGGDTVMECLMNHRDAPIPSLRQARGEVPAELERIFHKMVAKRPQDRYQSMTEVITALQAHQASSSGGSIVESPLLGQARPLSGSDLSATVAAAMPSSNSGLGGQVAITVATGTATRTSDTDASQSLQLTQRQPATAPATTPTAPVRKTPVFAGVAAAAVLLVAAGLYFSGVFGGRGSAERLTPGGDSLANPANSGKVGDPNKVGETTKTATVIGTVVAGSQLTVPFIT